MSVHHVREKMKWLIAYAESVRADPPAPAGA
jgi:hypothetical protein